MVTENVRVIPAGEVVAANARARRAWVETVRRSDLDAKTQRFLAFECLRFWYGLQRDNVAC